MFGRGWVAMRGGVELSWQVFPCNLSGLKKVIQFLTFGHKKVAAWMLQNEIERHDLVLDRGRLVVPPIAIIGLA
jgi:hypothetical protein